MKTIKNACQSIALSFLICLPAFGQTPAIEMELTVRDNHNHSQKLTFGLAPSATAQIDMEFGEDELPPLPPQGIFDARFTSTELPDVELGQGSYRDFRTGDAYFSGNVVHEIHFQAASEDSIFVAWSLLEGTSVELQDVLGGVVIDTVLQGNGEMLVDNSSVIDKLLLNVSYAADSTLPALPEILYPADRADNVPLQPQLLWRSAAFAELYNLRFYTISDDSTLVLSRDGIADTSFALPLLLNGQTYEWHIQSVNGDKTSNWIVSRFTTASALEPPSVPNLLWPVENAEDIVPEPVVQWQSQEGAEFYDLQVYFAGSFSKLVLDESAIQDTFYQVTSLQPGTLYFWRLRAGNNAGTSEWSELRQFKTGSMSGLRDDKILQTLAFFPNYPNPFNPVTSFKFNLDKMHFVRLDIVNIQGQIVGTLINKYLPMGEHIIHWDATVLPSGNYFAVFQADEFKSMQKISLVK